MQRMHMPDINVRYWCGIALASVFGTNLGDFYAHESGLGIASGLAVLALIAAVIFGIERVHHGRTELFYWLVILIIRTGATNIADYLAFRVRLPEPWLTLGLAALLAGFAFWQARLSAGGSAQGPGRVPDTGAPYWLAMLSAGVFGTALGDVCSHAFGEGPASIGLGILLVACVLLYFRAALFGALVGYWCTIAVARTAGTCIGDWLAENRALHIGLPLSTLITALAFAAVLLLWRRPVVAAAAA